MLLNDVDRPSETAMESDIVGVKASRMPSAVARASDGLPVATIDRAIESATAMESATRGAKVMPIVSVAWSESDSCRVNVTDIEMLSVV